MNCGKTFNALVNFEIKKTLDIYLDVYFTTLSIHACIFHPKLALDNAAYVYLKKKNKQTLIIIALM